MTGTRITREQIRAAAREHGWEIRAANFSRSDIFARGGTRVTVRYRWLDGKGYVGGVTDLYVDGWAKAGKDKARQAMDLLRAESKQEGARSR